MDVMDFWGFTVFCCCPTCGQETQYVLKGREADSRQTCYRFHCDKLEQLIKS